MPEPACPGCGETQALRGRAVGDDIKITCEHCGAEWLRGNPRCERCGQERGISAPQNMINQPRNRQWLTIDLVAELE